MQNFLITLLTCSVAMSALALIYMACTPFLIKRYSEKGHYYAWLVVVIGLIVPFRPQWNVVPIFQIGNDTSISIAQTIENAALYSAVPSISRWQIAAMVWLAGVIIFLSCHAIKHYRFVKMTNRWSVGITDEQTLALIQSLKEEMGIAKRIELYVCSCVGSPMMISFVKPRIFLPTTELAHDELRFIFKHELVHYKRKDLLYKYMVLAATAIHWFNPVVYLVAKEIANLCEMSCDAEVVKNADADTRQFYSEAIIGVVKYQSKLKTVLSTNYYGGKKGMRNRISSIMDMNNKKAGIAIVCMALVITLGTGVVFAANVNATTSNNALSILEIVPVPISVINNGSALTFDQPPIVENGRTLVPLRAIFEGLDADVEWDQSTQTVTAVRGGIKITLQNGSNILTRNSEQITLDVPPQIVGGRSLVPLRAIAESFGAEVDWNANTRTVTITE